MSVQCPEIRSADGKRCERDELHDGAHIHGFDTGLVVAWGWASATAEPKELA